MSKTPNFFCTDCGTEFNKWQGQCHGCKAWNTIKEFKETKVSGTKTIQKGTDLSTTKPTVKPLNAKVRTSTGFDEVDRVLGGGFFSGSFVLFGGTPGIGKSTLALQMFTNLKDALYFSGEESAEQVLNRAQRLNPSALDDLSERIFSTNSLEDILATVQTKQPPLIVIDSIQMVGLADSSFGSMSQIRENAEILLKLAKQDGITVLVIGHVTKNDEIAGPKVLEHMVDTVLKLEGEKNTEIRLLRSPKNRFGSTLEVGVFEMKTNGLAELKNPSEFFLAERPANAFGSAITVVREGARNFLLEVQALTVKTNFGQPRRTSHGIDLSKFHLLLAVISKFTPFKCEEYDAYLNVVSGLRIKEPAADLAVMASIISSRVEKEIPATTVVLGEVGLSGEIRSVPFIENRLIEAAKLGFSKAIIPPLRGKKISIKNIQITEVKNILELTKALF
ncbi:DNA repair protein RadA [bacterium DOLZORAL124_38_8]|nr:MAG: DNA repair protein RadA [bacterium DOLZORAL124_38_8]